MDHRHTQAHVASNGLDRPHSLAIDLDDALKIGVHTRQDLDQRTLARAVLAGEDVHLAAHGLRNRRSQYRDRSKPLGNAAHPHQWYATGLANMRS